MKRALVVIDVQESFRQRPIWSATSNPEIGYSIICVVTPSTVRLATELVDFFAGLGCESVGFNIEEEEGAGRAAMPEEAVLQFWSRLWLVRAGG